MADDGGLSLRRAGRSLGPISAEVYETLLDALMEGRIQAGDRLIMDRLAEELDVSRTPVRDALQRLFREGLVEPAGRRGYLVREPSNRDTTDFYEARMAVEGAAAAQLSMSDSVDLVPVRHLLETIGRRSPSSTWESFEVNRQFHRGVVLATGNSYLLDMFDTIWNRSRTALTYSQFAAANPSQDFRCEHEELLRAIEGARPEAARASMTTHIRSGLDRTRRDARQERGRRHGS